jgi:hypothetical protein
MKIQGYELGTEVKWNDEESGAFRTGIVLSRYYDPDITEIDGASIEINVIGNSPAYKVEDERNQKMIIIDHSKVTMRHQNDHS